MTRKPLSLAIIIVALLPLWLSQPISCPEHCSYGQCDPQTGNCYGCSQDHWWGPTCSNECPQNCSYGYCDMQTGQCGSCSQDHWWGPTCSNPCPENCAHGYCDMKTGYCGGCSQDHWWGVDCSKPCPEHCSYGYCDMQTGQCGGCSQDHWWGPTCSNECPENCAYGYCNMQTGCCDGCKDGYSGNCTCSISPECANPKGVNCDWYSDCLLSATKDCPIIKDTMGAKCQEYFDLESSLSPTGAEWSQYVRSCLQNVLAKNALIPAPSGSVDCQTATDTFFGDHLGCYLNGPISFCQLPYGDITKIIKHGMSILFTSHWYDPLVTGAQLKYACDVEFWETVLQDHFTKSKVLLSDTLSCSDVNVSASLVSSMNQKLAPQNWIMTFESAKDVTKIEGNSILLLSSLNSSQYPLNVTLATGLVVEVMREWQANNTQCNLMFNGQNISLAEEPISRSKFLFETL